MRNAAERYAVNAVIQGSAADLIKRAMLAVDARIRDEGLRTRMLLQIHDELVFEAPDAEIPTLAELVREAMVTALDLKVPLKVDLSAGPNWLDVQPTCRRHAAPEGRWSVCSELGTGSEVFEVPVPTPRSHCRAGRWEGPENPHDGR